MRLSTFSIFGLDLESIDIAFFVGSVILLLFFASFILRDRRTLNKQILVKIEKHKTTLKIASMQKNKNAKESVKQKNLSHSRQHLLRFLPFEKIEERRRLLKGAGFVSDHSVSFFFLTKTVFMLLAAVFFFMFFFFPLGLHWNREIWLFLTLLMIVFFFGCDAFVRQRRKARLRRIEQNVPDCLDLLVICAEAGLSLDAALKRVADEFVDAVPELAEELLLTSVELNFLPDRRQALANLSQRIDLAAFRGVTTALIQTEKYGTPLANALRTLSAEFRDSRLLRAEEKAARLPAILTVPMICFILPSLFIVLAGPAFISVAEKIGSG